MSKPWEKFQTAETASGPWSKFQATEPAKPAKQERSTLRNLAEGFAGGVGDVVDTVWNVATAIPGKIVPQLAKFNEARGQGLNDWIDERKDSTAFQVGRVGGNIAATLPTGGFLGTTAQAVKAPAALTTAIRTGGMKAGVAPGAVNMLTRTAGGAITGGAMAGLVNPEDAVTGAVIGGALPPGLKIAGEAGKLINKGAAAAGKNAFGLLTGTGPESIGAAYQAGKRKSTAFLDNMRGNASFDDVVMDAKSALQKMRADRSATYRSGMVDISNDKSVIDFVPISNAVSKISQMGSYKGQQINKNAAGTVDEIAEMVNKWRSLEPSEFHTPEGLDALKQAIGDIRDSTQFGTAARRAADDVYNAIKNQITAQAPTYSKVMKDYSEATATLKEIEKSLSLGDKASSDTAVRKLQSLLRNNAQSNYGNRLELAKALEDKGGVSLMDSIAGQTMNSLMPRGITGAIQKGGAVVGAVGTGGASIPLTIAAAPFTSPRIVGESLYGIGRLSGAAGNSLNKLTQGAPGLSANNPTALELANALYRTAPLLATSTNR